MVLSTKDTPMPLPLFEVINASGTPTDLKHLKRSHKAAVYGIFHVQGRAHTDILLWRPE